MDEIIKDYISNELEKIKISVGEGYIAVIDKGFIQSVSSIFAISKKKVNEAIGKIIKEKSKFEEFSVFPFRTETLIDDLNKMYETHDDLYKFLLQIHKQVYELKIYHVSLQEYQQAADYRDIEKQIMTHINKKNASDEAF